MTEIPDKKQRHCLGCTCMSPLFCLLSEKELQLVDANKIHIVFKAGETIRKQGTYMSHVLSVNDGLAKLYLEGIEGQDSILRIVKPTNFIGGPGIYSDQRHHFSVSALVDTSVCFIDIGVFKGLLNGNRRFAEEFMKDFSQDVRSVYNRLIFLTQKQVPGRMSDALLYLYEEVFGVGRFPMVLSRADLAALSAMSRESAVKVLRDFQKEGLIRISDNELEILNPDALRKISRIG